MSVSKATFLDLKQLSSIGSDVVDNLLPYLSRDESRVQSLLQSYVSDSNAMILVSKQDGIIKGGAVAITSDIHYAKKKNTQIIGLYTTVTGDGMEMLSQIETWFLSRANSLLMCYASPADSRLDKLLELKFKFNREGTMPVRSKSKGTD